MAVWCVHFYRDRKSGVAGYMYVSISITVHLPMKSLLKEIEQQ